MPSPNNFLRPANNANNASIWLITFYFVAFTVKIVGLLSAIGQFNLNVRRHSTSKLQSFLSWCLMTSLSLLSIILGININQLAFASLKDESIFSDDTCGTQMQEALGISPRQMILTAEATLEIAAAASIYYCFRSGMREIARTQCGEPDDLVQPGALDAEMGNNARAVFKR